jgi:hypothetical protein
MQRYPFTASAFFSAIEMAEASPLLEVETRTLVPILGLLQGFDEAGVEQTVQIGA